MTDEGAKGQPVAEPSVGTPAISSAPDIVATFRRGPSLLAFMGWRLLELAATLAAAFAVTSALLQPQAPVEVVDVVERLQVTAPLLLMTVLIAALSGLPLGYVAARAGSWADIATRGLATVGGSLSPVWLSMLLVLLLAIGLGWLQPAGFVPWAQSTPGALTSLLLPALGLGLPLAADVALRFRDELRLVIDGPVVRTAEDTMLSRVAAVHRHGLRAALAETARGMVLPAAIVVPASLVIENVFYLPGLGRMIFSALDTRDLATLQAGLVVLVALIGLVRLCLLLLQAVADPRIASRA